MSTYYDELGLSPQASAAELQTALDARYNQYRNLVTHPDATVVEEANRNLRLLEQMRAALTNTNRRAAYDAGISVGGAGGLADPAAILRKATPPPPPRATLSPTQTGAPADLWTCPNCSTPNPEWTPFCLHCRTPLLRQCPECGKMKSLVKTGACSNCGYEYDVAKRRVEKRAALNAELTSLQEQVSTQKEIIAVLTTKRGVLLFLLVFSSFYTAVGVVSYFGVGSTEGYGSDLAVKILLATPLVLSLALFFWRKYRAIKLKITTEQTGVVAEERRIQELREAYTGLGPHKQL